MRLTKRPILAITSRFIFRSKAAIERKIKIYFIANDKPPNHDGAHIPGFPDGYHWGHKGFNTIRERWT
jgi:hypothetical protein